MKPPKIIETEVVDISSTDHTFTNTKIDGLFCNATGTITARIKGEVATRPYKVVVGSKLYGDFDKVIKVGTTLTAANDIIGFVEDSSD